MVYTEIRIIYGFIIAESELREFIPDEDDRMEYMFDQVDTHPEDPQWLKEYLKTTPCERFHVQHGFSNAICNEEDCMVFGRIGMNYDFKVEWGQTDSSSLDPSTLKPMTGPLGKKWKLYLVPNDCACCS